MISYGLYSTQGIPLKTSKGHMLTSEWVYLIDKYSIWVSFVITAKNQEVHYHIVSRFDYIKEPFGRFNRNILVVDIDPNRPGDLKKLYLEAIREIHESQDIDFTYEDSLSRSEYELLKKRIREQEEAVDRIMYEIEKYYIKGHIQSIYDIPYRELTLPVLSEVDYPSLAHRSIFIVGVREALVNNPENYKNMFKNYEDVLLSTGEDIPIFLFNYARSSYSSFGGLWVVSEGGEQT